MTKNPLIQPSELPPFKQIKPEHVKPVIFELIETNRRKIAEILEKNTDYSWENVVLPLEELDDQLNQAWSPVGHLNSVKNSPELREAYQACLPALSDYGTDIGQNKALFDAYQTIGKTNLDPIQQKVIDDALRDFRLAGVALSDDDKQRYKAISQQLSDLSNQFSNNTLDATQAWQKQVTDAGQLSGIPEHAMTGFKQNAAQKNLDGYVITLEFPDYYAVITYCDNAALRQEMYQAYVTRASDQGPNAGKFDNSEVMEKIVALRQEKAKILGFQNYAELSLATKMADGTDDVIKFLDQLIEKSLPIAKQDIIELKAFAKETDQIDTLNAWDISYYSEKLRQKKYSVSQDELRVYFPLPNVLNGLFSICNTLFDIDIQPIETFEAWHDDVQLFSISRKGEPLAKFYLDLFARENKRGGAWMDECRTRRVTSNQSIQNPVAYLTCNFTPPINNQPALLTHDEVLTLFHEFGHGLHHMLTKIDYAAVSGINGVAWDAVELPSQFLENWCWGKSGLDLISGHFETNEPLPESLLKNLLAAKNFQAGMQMVRQIEFALFDFKLHLEFNGTTNIQVLLDSVRDQVSVFRPPSFNRFQHSFGHIFAGGYAAGYYSYKWAEVLAADAFSKFEETGILNPITGQEFLNSILEQGGSREAMDLFVKFRGRKPSIDALLRHNGMLE